MGGGARKVLTPDPGRQATGLPRYRRRLLAAYLASLARPVQSRMLDATCAWSTMHVVVAIGARHPESNARRLRRAGSILLQLGRHLFIQALSLPLSHQD